MNYAAHHHSASTIVNSSASSRSAVSFDVVRGAGLERLDGRPKPRTNTSAATRLRAWRAFPSAR
jgi:hypothetical protein